MKKAMLLLVLIVVSGCIMVPVYPEGTIVQPSQYDSPAYYTNPPFYPGYAWQYWYTTPMQPGFVFFFGKDGRHHRHPMRGGSRGGRFRSR